MRMLEGRVALISGSGRGIGKAVALRLAGEGASIVVNDIDEAPAAETVAEVTAAGGRAVACVGSVTEAGFSERFVDAALSNFGGLDIIVNNAGYTLDGLIQRQSDEQFQAMLDVHTIAPFRILRAAAGPIKEFAKKEAGEGREVMRKVVNVSSMAGTNGNAGQINYSAAKSALIGMTKTMSKEWGRYKVCVNCVAFGMIGTRLTGLSSEIVVDGKVTRVGVPDDQLEAFRKLIPLGRFGRPEEAAGAIWMLCSPDSDYISGQVILAGGGMAI